ncbi:putative toxin [Methylovulum miyakonense]|uniref:putative toxin n=1 Tax=Methylovulum miyakonense TaxID=645578 RepID=UPI00037204BA|nr:putative toxin [Methylovulum miyakonense]
MTYGMSLPKNPVIRFAPYGLLAAVRSQNDIGDRERFRVNGRDRISDGSNRNAVSEVKNVQNTQSLTQQIRDTIQHAQETNRAADLYLPESTKVTGPLQDAIDNGFVTRKPIP